MLRLALRGLLARKLRTALTGFAVVIGVAFVAGTFIFTDTIDASFKDLFERVSKGVDVNVTAKQPVEGDFGGRIQPLPPGTLEKVDAADGVEAAEARFETGRVDLRQGRRADRRQRPAVDRVLAQRGALRPADLRRGRARPSEPGAGHDRPGDRRQGGLRGRRQDPDRRPRARASATRSSASRSSATRSRSASRRSIMPLAEVQRIAAGARRDHRGGRGGRRRHVARGAQGRDQRSALGGTAVVRTGKEQAEEAAARHQRLARLPQDRACSSSPASPCSSAAS